MFRREWGGGGTLARENGAKTRSMHPNQKPIALMRWCIEKCPPGTVLDPYMGSGTTIRAAKDLGRKAIGIEIEERYCEIAAKRLAQGVLDLA
jgi:site-specific DNA-methyltransferase (adenine-specific)